MRHVSGITGAGPIWHDFMEEALEQKPGDEFPLPSGMVWRDICTISGLLVNPDCPSRRREVFIAGTEPKETCDQHLRVEVDKRTGKKALPETPMDYLEERVFWLPPPELRDWAREKGIPLLETDSPPYTPSIALVSPEPKSILVIDPHLPLDYQRIEVKALAYDEWRVERVELYVDDEILAVLTEPPYRTLWQLREGEHTFYALAIGSDGRKEQSQKVKVIVKSQNP
jgi:penicillin-binding protein 1C